MKPGTAAIAVRVRVRLRALLRAENGLATTEMAILMPFILILVLVVTFAGQVAQHHSRTQAAADHAARVAAFALTEDEGQLAADQVISQNCAGTATVDVAFKQAPGNFSPGWLEVVATCTESFDRFAILLGSSERTATARAVAALEFWRPSP